MPSQPGSWTVVETRTIARGKAELMHSTSGEWAVRISWDDDKYDFTKYDSEKVAREQFASAR